MKHLSVPIENTMEVLPVTQSSPLLTECYIKVCYVSDTANRNGTVITKEIAQQMGEKLPGSPVVGLYNKDTNDFVEHSRAIEINKETGEFELIDLTKAYGFVGDKIWFQDFMDDGENRRTYLCAQAFLWTSAYPEAKCILNNNSNQSMELNNESVKGFWTNDINNGRRIFIINEALIEKLCLLGQDYEPCFEGAQVRTEFSLQDEIQSLRNEVHEFLHKYGGGQTNMDTVIKEQPIITDEENTSFTKKDEEKKKDQDQEQEDTTPESNDEEKDDEDKKKKKNEYAELSKMYVALEGKYNELNANYTTLQNEIQELREFKKTSERESKQKLINGFYMLSDADKKDVVDHIDEYSLDEIESKLSVIYTRAKLNAEESEDEASVATNYTVDLEAAAKTTKSPAWVQAIHDVEAEK